MFCQDSKMSLTHLALNSNSPVVLRTEVIPIVSSTVEGTTTMCHDAEFGIGDLSSIYISCLDYTQTAVYKKMKITDNDTTMDRFMNDLKAKNYNDDFVKTKEVNKFVYSTLTVSGVRLFRYDLSSSTFDDAITDENQSNLFIATNNEPLRIKTLSNATNYFIVVYQRNNNKMKLFTIDHTSKKTINTPKAADIDLSNGQNIARIFKVDQWTTMATGILEVKFVIFGYLNGDKPTLVNLLTTTVFDATTHAYTSISYLKVAS